MRTEGGRITKISFGRTDKFDTFRRICVDGQETDFVICLSCDDSKLLVYSTKFGSKRLNDHLVSAYHVNKYSNKTCNAKIHSLSER